MKILGEFKGRNFNIVMSLIQNPWSYIIEWTILTIL